MVALHYEDGSVENYEIGIVNGKIPEKIDRICMPPVGLWRNLTADTYFLAAMSSSSPSVYHVLSESKNLDELDTDIDFGCPVIAKILFDDHKLYMGSDKCPSDRRHHLGDICQHGVIVAYSDDYCYYLIKEIGIDKYHVHHWSDISMPMQMSRF